MGHFRRRLYLGYKWFRQYRFSLHLLGIGSSDYAAWGESHPLDMTFPP